MKWGHHFLGGRCRVVGADCADACPTADTACVNAKATIAKNALFIVGDLRTHFSEATRS
jgi:hypothetical protein